MSQSFLSFIFSLLAVAPAGTKPVVAPVQPMSLEEMQARVRIDASRTFQVTFDDVKVLDATERTWPDRSLGCAATPAAEPETTSGFRIIVKVKAERLTYHTDRFGRVVRCAAAPAKTN